MADEQSADCCSISDSKHGTFDLAILGGGSAAFSAARRASDLGASEHLDFEHRPACADFR